MKAITEKEMLGAIHHYEKQAMRWRDSLKEHREGWVFYDTDNSIGRLLDTTISSDKRDPKLTAGVLSEKKLLVIGHGGHGKDSVCAWLNQHYGTTSASSSMFVCANYIHGLFQHDYATAMDCYQDRHRWRELWFQLIRYYCQNNDARVAEEILSEHTIYNGMRSRDEFEASKHLFDHIIWVDASERVKDEPAGSMELTRRDAQIIVNNNRTEGEMQSLLREQLYNLGYGVRVGAVD